MERTGRFVRTICCTLRLAVLWLSLAILPPGGSASAQPAGASLPVGVMSISVTPALRDSLIRLPHQFIAAESETLSVDSLLVLRRGIDYAIVYRYGTLRLDTAAVAALLARMPQARRTLSLRYSYFPFHFQDTYSKRTLTTLPGGSGKDSLRVAKPRGSFNVDDIFGPNLQKSGSIVRGFTIGSNRDLSLNSGFRMQLAGKIGSDIDISAALTDENTPIQPEGTTQTLQEFDKVYVEIRSSSVSATLGDFVLDLNGQEFSRLSRKLQGAEATGALTAGSMDGSVLVAGAVTRGKFNTMQFNGLDAVQGPYRLTGRNGERSIIVIAGTERVYVNGDAMTRGETNDYTIDYSTGEITFTARRLITAASRITIDYEYTDRQYSRSLFGSKVATGLFDGKARLTFTYLREADDPDAPIDFSVTDSARAILAAAGSDRSKAVTSGITAVDSGGVYKAVDTVLTGGAAVRFYRYAPGDPLAKYTVTFSFVGTGQGEYTRQQAGVFVWNGPGGGDYMPIVQLPFPQSTQIMDMSIDTKPLPDLTLTGEYARSTFNANRFSSLPGVAASDGAMKLSAAYSPRKIIMGGMDFGGLDLTLFERKVGSLFTPIDRTNDIEFTRKWGVDTLATGDEEIREGTLRYMPVDGVTVGGEYGRITRGDAQSSVRKAGSFSLKGPGLPLVSYSLEDVHATDREADNASAWLRQKGSAAYALGWFTPTFVYEGERREITPIEGSTYRDGTFSYDMYGPKLGVKDLGPMTLSAEYVWRDDNLANGGVLLRQSNSFTQTYAGRLAERGSFASSLDVTLRERRFTPEFRLLGNSDVQTVLVRSQSRYSPLNRGIDLDLYYETETQRTSKLERVFVRVPVGTGNYKYLGDLNANGIADDNEFVETRFDGDFIAITVPTDALFPIIDLNSSVRARITPSRFIERGGGFWSKALNVLTTETYARVEEKSSEPDLKQIYLLHLKKFLNDSTTIAGSQLFTQDVLLWDGQPDFSSRVRFSERHGLINYSGGIERSYVRERSLRLRWQLVPEISNQFDFVNKIDRLSSQESSSRVHDVLSNSFAFDFSYRPEQNLELGMKFELANSTDRFQIPAVNAALNTQSVRCVYAFQGAGQARVEASREEDHLDRSLDSYPYELTGGRVPGITWIWRAAFDYRVTQFVQASLAYDGRAEGGLPPVHTARAEVRAFF